MGTSPPTALSMHQAAPPARAAPAGLGKRRHVHRTAQELTQLHKRGGAGTAPDQAATAAPSTRSRGSRNLAEEVSITTGRVLTLPVTSLNSTSAACPAPCCAHQRPCCAKQRSRASSAPFLARYALATSNLFTVVKAGPAAATCMEQMRDASVLPAPVRRCMWTGRQSIGIRPHVKFHGQMA